MKKLYHYKQSNGENNSSNKDTLVVLKVVGKADSMALMLEFLWVETLVEVMVA